MQIYKIKLNFPKKLWGGHITYVSEVSIQITPCPIEWKIEIIIENPPG